MLLPRWVRASFPATDNDIDIVKVEKNPHFGLFRGRLALGRIVLYEIRHCRDTLVHNSSSRPSTRGGSTTGTAWAVTRPVSSRVITAGGVGRGGTSIGTGGFCDSAICAGAPLNAVVLTGITKITAALAVRELHRVRRGARMLRRDKGACRQYSTEKQHCQTGSLTG